MSRWKNMRGLLASYFYLDPSSVEPLEETMERVKADCPRAEVDAILAELAELLRHNDADLEVIYETDLQSYYWPGGDGLTTRQWLALLERFLKTPPDTSRDHRSGIFE